MQLTSQFLNKSRVCFNSQLYKGPYHLTKILWDLCLRDYLHNHGGATPKVLYKKDSLCTQKPVTSNIKRLSMKLLKLITRKAKNPLLLLVHSVVSYLLPFASPQDQGITALTYSLPQATEIPSPKVTIRELFLPPLCRAACNEGMVRCFLPLCHS